MDETRPIRQITGPPSEAPAVMRRLCERNRAPIAPFLLCRASL